MKKYFIITTLILYLTNSYAQISQDTVICIIDTTKNYVSYNESLSNTSDQKEQYWDINIKGSYYNHRPDYKACACIFFVAGQWRYSGLNVSGFPKIKIHKNYLKKKVIKSEEWIHNQKSADTLSKVLGSFPRDKTNYIIFNSDFINQKTDSVTLHRVKIGYCGVEVD